MRFWISKNSEVPLREQLITQVNLAVGSGELNAGDRLPSTREIARRYGVHPNTVAAAYQDLVAENTLEFRHGSGYFVREHRTKVEGIDSRIDDLITFSKNEGVSIEDLIRKLRVRKTGPVRKKLLLIESDPGLREILIA
jgi:GntR family transcriptional regulator